MGKRGKYQKNILTKAEQGFVKDYASGDNGVTAVKKNFNPKDDHCAGTMSSIILKREHIQKALKSIADSIPDKELLKVHKEGLKAHIKGEPDEPDFGTRHKYLDSAYKIKGTYAPEKTVNATVIINATDEKSLEIAKKYEEELKKEL